MTEASSDSMERGLRNNPLAKSRHKANQIKNELQLRLVRLLSELSTQAGYSISRNGADP